MQSQATETVTRVKVEFTETEYKLLIDKVPAPQSLAEFIHQVVMKSLHRKKRAKKGVDGGN